MHSTEYALDQRFSIPVLVPPRSAYFACLSLLTHLIQIISLLEVRSVHELCSDWHAPYTGSIAPYTGSIAPYSLSREIRWSLLYFGTFIHGFALRNVFTHERVWHNIPLIYTILIHVLHTSMHFEWNIYVRFELESWRSILWCALRRALTFE